MILTGVVAAVLYFRKKLFDTRWFQFWCMALTPSGFIAVLAGWFVTEIGRQPYIVYGVLRTSDTISPVIGPNIALSLLALYLYLCVRFRRRKLLHPAPDRQRARVHGRRPTAPTVSKTPPLVTDLVSETGGGQNV